MRRPQSHPKPPKFPGNPRKCGRIPRDPHLGGPGADAGDDDLLALGGVGDFDPVAHLDVLLQDQAAAERPLPLRAVPGATGRDRPAFPGNSASGIPKPNPKPASAKPPESSSNPSQFPDIPTPTPCSFILPPFFPKPRQFPVFQPRNAGKALVPAGINALDALVVDADVPAQARGRAEGALAQVAWEFLHGLPGKIRVRDPEGSRGIREDPRAAIPTPARGGNSVFPQIPAPAWDSSSWELSQKPQS